MKRVAYIECSSGASGDMFLGAWLDLGIDERAWMNLLRKLNVTEYRLSQRTVYKNGIRSNKVDVILEADEHHHEHHEHHHRHLPDIYNLLDQSQLPEPVLHKSKEAFRLLAQAEGKIHGLPFDQVHFHEVGAVDAIVDIVGSMLGWYLAGMPECYVSSIEIGGGTVRCEHGLMPVPAPATAELLMGFTTHSSGNWGETVTPTGAAIIRALCRPGTIRDMVTEKIGYGAGTKDLQIANVLRIQLGTKDISHLGDESGAQATGLERICVLEANVDDMTPEWAAYAANKLLQHGALDAWWTPIVMKKGRPALQFSLLCHLADRDRFLQLIQSETTTIGVRVHEMVRSVLERELEEVQTTYGAVRVKVAYQAGELRNIAPEYEDCRVLAEQHDVPLKQIYHLAIAAFYALKGQLTSSRV